MASDSFHILEEHINNIRVVDTHEHMQTEEEWLAVPESRLDFSQLMHYVELDVMSAGMPVVDMNKVRFTDLSEDEKWKSFEPYWENTRNTSFAKVIEMTVRDFYGLPGLNRDTYKEIGKRIRETRKPGHYKEVLKDTAKIEISILDTGCTNPDRSLFLPTVRLDHFLWFKNSQDLKNLEKKLSIVIGSLTDLENELIKAVENAKYSGIIAIKTAQSYLRTLRYEYVGRTGADAAFNTVSTSEDNAAPENSKTLSDYLFYRMVEACIEHDLPIQIHTGMNAGNAVALEPTNPIFLTDVFLHYPEAKFDVFHAGFPFYEEMGVLVKTFPNIRADLCWTHIVSPSASRRALDVWLELAPANKLFAFGGDLGSVEIAACHLKIAKKNITMVLADKVDDGYFTLDEARRIADMILRDNAKEFYRLELQHQ